MNNINNFFEFLNNSTSPFYVIKNSCDILDKEGFKSLSIDEPWELEKGGSYYVKLYDTALYAFKIGEDINDTNNDLMLRMAVAHTDFPSFRIKPNAEMKEKGYIKLNTEAYGGLILSSWFDRPLSISGKVSLKSEKTFQPREMLIDFKRSLLVIPNLAIHLNREVNKGVEINKQTDVLPLLGMSDEKLHNYINTLIAEELDVPVEDILDYDLFIYNTDKACTVGMNNEFICAPRLDDLTSVYGLLQGIIGDVCGKDIHMIALFDNEEIGNRTKQGSASLSTLMLMEKLFDALGRSRIEMYDVFHRSIILSMDVAQAYHPNYTGKFDPTNIAELNKGIVFKIDTLQRYAFDTGAVGMIQQLCEENNIPYQKYTNRSDATAGSTMGPVISTQLPTRTVDMGVAILAMHSAVETMGTKDQESLNRLMRTFFSVSR